MLLMKGRRRGGEHVVDWPRKINNVTKMIELQGKRIHSGKERESELGECWLRFHFHTAHRGLDGRTCVFARLQMCHGVLVYCKWPETSNSAEGERLAMRLLCLWDVHFSFDCSTLKNKAAHISFKTPQTEKAESCSFFKTSEQKTGPLCWAEISHIR